MSDYGEPFGAKWVNSIAVDAYARLEAIADSVVETLLADGFPPLTQPYTLADLKTMAVPAVAALLQGMLSDPSQAAAATKLAADYSSWFIAQQRAQYPASEVNALPKAVETEMAKLQHKQIDTQIGVKP